MNIQLNGQKNQKQRNNEQNQLYEEINYPLTKK